MCIICMSKIDDLESQLYRPEGGKEIAERMRRRVVFPETLRRPEKNWQEEPVTSPEVKKARHKKVLKFFLWLSALLFILGGI